MVGRSESLPMMMPTWGIGEGGGRGGGGSRLRAGASGCAQSVPDGCAAVRASSAALRRWARGPGRARRRVAAQQLHRSAPTCGRLLPGSAAAAGAAAAEVLPVAARAAAAAGSICASLARAASLLVATILMWPTCRADCGWVGGVGAGAWKGGVWQVAAAGRPTTGLSQPLRGAQCGAGRGCSEQARQQLPRPRTLRLGRMPGLPYQCTFAPLTR
jgi:hypothetical protein